MKTVFADTFYWIALTIPADSSYAQAHRFTDDIVTTDEVLGEYLTFFSRRQNIFAAKRRLTR